MKYSHFHLFWRLQLLQSLYSPLTEFGFSGYSWESFIEIFPRRNLTADSPQAFVQSLMRMILETNLKKVWENMKHIYVYLAFNRKTISIIKNLWEKCVNISRWQILFWNISGEVKYFDWESYQIEERKNWGSWHQKMLGQEKFSFSLPFYFLSKDWRRFLNRFSSKHHLLYRLASFCT